jgi:diguanylate cyclase (GGDEF)-like protein/PAS domain S-box-containing protein
VIALRWIDPQFFFADTRRSLIAVALLVALPTIVLSEVAVGVSGARIRAAAQERANLAAQEIASEHADRVTRLAQELHELAARPRLATWVRRGVATEIQARRSEPGGDIVALVLVDEQGDVVASDPPGIASAVAPELLGPRDRVVPPLVSRLYPGSAEVPPYFAVSTPLGRDAYDGTLIAIVDADQSIRWTVGLMTVFEDVHVVDPSGVGLSAARLRAGESGATDARSLSAVSTGSRLRGGAPVVGTSWHVLVTQSVAATDDEIAFVAAAFRALDAALLALVFAGSVLLARRMRRILRQRERLRAVQELAHVGGWEWDIWGDRVSVSEEVLRIYGLRRGEGADTYRAVLARIHPEDRDKVETDILRALRGHAELSVRHRIVRTDGSVRIVETRGTPIGERGRATRMRGTAQDVTELMRREEERSRLTALIDAADEALITSTLDGTITSWNQGAERMLGYTAAETIGRSMQDLRPSERRKHRIRLLDRVRGGESVTDHNSERVRKDGTRVSVAIAVSPLRDASGEVVGAAWSFRDVGAVKRAEAELAHRVSHDGLTDLPNRFLFEDRLDRAIRAAQRSGRSLAVMTIDLHRFRDVNHAFGHTTGDLVLFEVAKRLSGQGRAIDTVARLTGDRFGLLIPETDQSAAMLVASRVRSELQRPIEVGGGEFALDVTAGIAMYPLHGEDVSTLLRRSERALEIARAEATGSALYSADHDDDAEDRATVVAELRRGIEQDQLTVHYQPVVNIASGQILGVEALVRWDHPTRGLIAPSQFVPLAEQSSLMGSLTRDVLEKALRQYRRWHEQGYALPVLVNISPRDLRDPSFVPTIEALHEAYRVSPTWLKLEITEGFVVDDPERAIVTLRRMRELGILIAIDDFGTGYSSLAYLGRLPVDAVKIDRSFVAAMRSDPKNAAIVRATIGLAHTLGFGTVAEGVEDDATLALVKEMGSDMAQGYGIARPMTAEALDEWLRTSRWQPRRAPDDTAGRGWTAGASTLVAAD